MVQYNRFYGCPYCLEEGKTCKTSTRGHIHVYPFNVNEPEGHATERTNNDTMNHAKSANEETLRTGKQSSVCGLKGLTWAMYFPGFDIV